MARLRENRKSNTTLSASCLVLALGLNLGCARSEPLHRSDASAPASEQSLPFHSDTGQSSNGASAPGALDPKQAASLPFRDEAHPRLLPAGTLLTVQLEDSLSTAKVRAGDEFTASVSAPLVLDQYTIVPRGTAVTGRVESARSLPAGPGRVPSSGYFRLTLSSIAVEGRQIAIQTSSLFARGSLQPLAGISVPKSRPLTFRLTAPVQLDEPNSAANPQSPSSITE